MKVSSFTTALVAIGIATAAARPSYRRPVDVKAKSSYYKELAKLIFLAGVDDRYKCQYRESYQCCKSYIKVEGGDEDHPVYQGIECSWIPKGLEDTCKDILHQDGFSKGCCSACTRSIPSYCMDCLKLE